MNASALLISRIIQDASVAAVLERGITPAMLPDKDAQEVLDFILTYARKHRATPSPTLIQEKFAFPLKYAPDAIDFYLEEVAEQYVRAQTSDALIQTAEALPDGTPTKVAAQLRSTIARLALTGAKQLEIEMSANTDERLERYATRKTQPGVTGIPTPWASMDDMTEGWNKETVNGFTARLKVGKSFALIKCGIHAYKIGARVVFVNREMAVKPMERRADGMLFELPATALRRGLLTTHEEQRYRDGLADQAAKRGDFADAGELIWVHGANSVSSIQGKVEQHSPDLVIVDGAYLLQDETGAKSAWERQMGISRGLKSLAQDFHVPLILSVQLGRDGDSAKTKRKAAASDVAGSDAYAQDCDTMFAMMQNEEERDAQQMRIEPLALRDDGGAPFLISWDFSTCKFEDLGTQEQMIVAASKSSDSEYE